jgi:hypothetical protein
MTSEEALEFNRIGPEEMLDEQTFLQARPTPVGEPFASLF